MPEPITLAFSCCRTCKEGAQADISGPVRFDRAIRSSVQRKTVRLMRLPSVTSDLAFRGKFVDHGQGGGGIQKFRGIHNKSIVFNILTLNPFTLKILQTLFAKPAPVKFLPWVGGEGGTPCKSEFPKTDLLEMSSPHPDFPLFFREIFTGHR
jgi:hypothetical protein